MNGERPTGYWWYKRVPVPVKQKVFKAHVVPQGECENLIYGLMQSAKQQKDGDSSIQSIATGLCARSRKTLWRASETL